MKGDREILRDIGPTDEETRLELETTNKWKKLIPSVADELLNAFERSEPGSKARMLKEEGTIPFPEKPES